MGVRRLHLSSAAIARGAAEPGSRHNQQHMWLPPQPPRGPYRSIAHATAEFWARHEWRRRLQRGWRRRRRG
eukprot:scaffold9849_cov79-Isochrysis_galbana.AAC.1